MNKYLLIIGVLVGVVFIWVSLVVIPADIRRSCQHEVKKFSDSDLSVVQADYIYMECVRGHGLSR